MTRRGRGGGGEKNSFWIWIDGREWGREHLSAGAQPTQFFKVSKRIQTQSECQRCYEKQELAHAPIAHRHKLHDHTHSTRASTTPFLKPNTVFLLWAKALWEFCESATCPMAVTGGLLPGVEDMCSLEVKKRNYSGPGRWNGKRKSWESKFGNWNWKGNAEIERDGRGLFKNCVEKPFWAGLTDRTTTLRFGVLQWPACSGRVFGGVYDTKRRREYKLHFNRSKFSGSYWESQSQGVLSLNCYLFVIGGYFDALASERKRALVLLSSVLQQAGFRTARLVSRFKLRRIYCRSVPSSRIVGVGGKWRWSLCLRREACRMSYFAKFIFFQLASKKIEWEGALCQQFSLPNLLLSDEFLTWVVPTFFAWNDLAFATETSLKL